MYCKEWLSLYILWWMNTDTNVKLIHDLQYNCMDFIIIRVHFLSWCKKKEMNPIWVDEMFEFDYQ